MFCATPANRFFPVLSILCLSILFGLAAAGPANAASLGAAFTYQGRLNDQASAANGTYDFSFTLFDSVADGNLVAGPLTNSAVPVAAGVFTVALDFAAGVFNGAAYWLEVGVRTNGAAAFTTLSPRQPLLATAYATYAVNAGAAATANSVLAANVSGTISLAQLPGGVLTNNAAGVSLSGAFSGSGAGLTNLPGSLNAKDYGAKGDGVTDDTAALNSLLSSAWTNGCSVFLPRGHYLITDTLHVYAFTTFYGEGIASVIQITNTSAEAIQAGVSWGNPPYNPGASITLRDFCVDDSYGNCAVVMMGVTNGLIDNVTVINPGLNHNHVGYGIWLRCLFNSLLAPTNLLYPCVNVTVQNCNVTNVTDTGIEFYGAFSCSAIGNHLSASYSSTAIYCWNSSSNCVFTGNTVIGTPGNSACGIVVDRPESGNLIQIPTVNNLVIGNTVSECDYVAFAIWTTYGVTNTTFALNSATGGGTPWYCGLTNWNGLYLVKNQGFPYDFDGSGCNISSGVNVFTNPANIFVGANYGDAAGLTNLNSTNLVGQIVPAQIAGGLTNNAAGATNLPNLISATFVATDSSGKAIPRTLSSGDVTAALGYTPPTNSFAGLTNSLGFAPATNSASGISAALGSTAVQKATAATYASGLASGSAATNVAVYGDQYQTSAVYHASAGLQDTNAAGSIIHSNGNLTASQDVSVGNTAYVTNGIASFKQGANAPLNIWTNVAAGTTYWTNTTGLSGFAIVGGGTVTDITLNNTDLKLTSGTVPMSTNACIGVTYSSAPVMNWVYQ